MPEDPTLPTEPSGTDPGSTATDSFSADPVPLPRLSQMPTQPVTAMSPAPPSLPGFEVLGELGRGGMGVVYKARQVEPPRLVALKMLLTGRHAHPGELARFRAEIEALAELHHPNIVPIYQVGEAESVPYFVMELVDGGSLAGWIAAQGTRITRCDQRDAAQLVETLARTVHFAHQRGIIHRDLKPANVLLRRKSEAPNPKSETGTGPEMDMLASDFGFRISDLEPKVTDFGLAKRLHSDPRLTPSRAVVGTLCYMAPEQAEGRTRDVGTLSDVYALGGILYELLTGRPPVQAKSDLEALAQLLNEERTPPRSLNPAIDRDLDTICLKCLEKDPARRYGSALDLADDLRRFLEYKPIRARRIGPWERAVKWVKRRRALAALIGISFVAVGALVALVLGLLYSRDLEDANLKLAASFEKADQQRRTLQQQQRDLDQQRREAERQRHEADTQRREAEGARRRSDEEAGKARRLQYATDMILAKRSLDDGQVRHVLDLLHRHRPERGAALDPRGFEWHYLLRVAQPTFHSFQVRPPGPSGQRWRYVMIRGMDFSPDGRLLATACSASSGPDQRLVHATQIWDLDTGREVVTLKGLTHPVRSVVFSADGKRLVTGGGDDRPYYHGGFAPGELKVWDAATGKELRALQRASPLAQVALGPDDRHLAGVGLDGSVRVWDLNTGQVLWSKPFREAVHGVAFHPDGARLAAAICAKVDVLETTTGKEQFTLDGPARDVNSVAFSPDGNWLAGGGADHKVYLWDARTKERVPFRLEHSKPVNHVAFSPDGQSLASGGMDQTVKVWDVRTGNERLSFRADRRWLWRLCWSPDASRLAAAGPDATILIWDATTGQEAVTLHEETGRPGDLLYRSDGTLVVCTGGLLQEKEGPEVDLRVQAFARGNAPGRMVRSVKGAAQSLTRAALSPDGQRLACGAEGNSLHVWDLTGKQTDFTLNGHSERVTCVAFSPDGRRLVSGSRDRTACVRDLEKRQILFKLERHGQAVGNVACSLDGRWIATAERSFTLIRFGPTPAPIKIWDAQTGGRVATLTAPDEVYSLAFSADGLLLAAGLFDGTVKLWEVPSEREGVTLEGHSEVVACVCFSADGRRLATASTDRILKVWDVGIAQEVLTLRAAAGSVARLVFRQDGRALAAVGSDGGLKVWSAESLEDETPEAQRAAARQRRLAWHRLQAAEAARLGDAFAAEFHRRRLKEPGK